ncbi:hypothetical protein L249_3985 [Ophiocordyceps polyrhachis-furcata BCC 54312]|uniref:BTB domain-containing protein n=1 Tax=Ophiocordyceps polyrhachis-furcata BCC 54312 TaxID=1330021 RepID=A0A367L5H1_9HYPO|nr:hypothetical protein L249_3985 [Ophiocordyceps polyrhachis-furcata BCC 54312]
MANNSALLALAELMKSGENSDLTFKCNGHDFKVHKLVVCGQSPVIKAALSPCFEEGRTNTINMNAFDHQTVGRLVRYLYTGDYDDSDGDSMKVDEEGDDSAVANSNSTPRYREPNVESLTIHIKVNSIGDYYGISKLMSLANVKLQNVFPPKGYRGIPCNIESPPWVLSLPNAVKLALESSGDVELLEILSAETANNISALVVTDDLKQMDDVSDFAFMVFKNCALEIQRHVRLNMALASQCTHNHRKIDELEKKVKEWESKDQLNNKTIEGLHERLIAPQKKRKTGNVTYF